MDQAKDPSWPAPSCDHVEPNPWITKHQLRRVQYFFSTIPLLQLGFRGKLWLNLILVLVSSHIIVLQLSQQEKYKLSLFFHPTLGPVLKPLHPSRYTYSKVGGSHSVHFCPLSSMGKFGPVMPLFSCISQGCCED